MEREKEKESRWVGNYFYIKPERLAEAVKLAMNELAKASPEGAEEWAIGFLNSLERKP